MSTDMRKVSRFGSFHVAEARIRNMLKWTGIILFAAVVNPALYLVFKGSGDCNLAETALHLSRMNFGKSIRTRYIIL